MSGARSNGTSTVSSTPLDDGLHHARFAMQPERKPLLLRLRADVVGGPGGHVHAPGLHAVEHAMVLGGGAVADREDGGLAAVQVGIEQGNTIVDQPDEDQRAALL